MQTAGSLFENTKLQSIHLISLTKTESLALGLKRLPGVCKLTERLMHPQTTRATTGREREHRTVQPDDARLGGTINGGKARCSLENKAPFVAAMAVDERVHSYHFKLAPVARLSLTRQGTACWACATLIIVSDVLACFAAIAAT